MKKILKVLTSKSLILSLLFIMQLVIIFFIFFYLVNDKIIGVYITLFFQIISVFVSLWIITNDDNPVYKMAWLIPVLAFPVFGTFFYLFYKQNNLSKKDRLLFTVIDNKRIEALSPYKKDDLENELEYLNNMGWPAFENTKSTFMRSGMEKLEYLLIDLKAATDFIFLEYFIIKKGQMFNELFSILVERAKAGVTVKVMYDDLGSADTLPRRFKKQMHDAGIEVIAFNPMKFRINFAMNYRDHRKVVVIDGKIGYTGGINIGDEYINKKARFGYWHDAAIRIEGEAVYSLTTTFLETWAFAHKSEDPNFSDFYRDYKVDTDGLVVPFADSPLDKNLNARNTYLYLINRAKHKIKIATPYLIMDNELLTALKLAALRGVDVSIIIPHIPDKKLVFIVTESYIPELVKAGVKVFRFTPGFIHSKLILIDDETGMVGTTNLDFRSLYLHFENNILVYDTESIIDMLTYFKDTLKACQLVTEDSLGNKNIFYRMLQAILKGFAPIL